MTPSSRHSVEDEPVPRLDEAEFVTVRLPFVHPLGTSVHTWTVKEALLLRLESEGITSWGECVADPDPYYLPETTKTCEHIIRDFLLPLVKPGQTLGELLGCFDRVRGNRMAKATVENALLNMVALKKSVPLHDLLGFQRKSIMSGLSIGLRDTPDELVRTVGEAVAKRYHRVKIKVARGRDVEYVSAVRRAFPGLRLMVDANGDYTLDDAPVLRQLDGFDLMMIEQPLSYADIIQHARLQSMLATPICLDESILSFDDAASAIEIGACRVLNIKQGRVGGLLESIRIARYASEHGVDVWSGGMDETGIGRAFNIHLQAANGFSVPGDTSETNNYFSEDIADPPVVLESDGSILIPPGPGLGIAVDPARIAKYLIRRERLQPRSEG
jgi:O-succinylbenzoate synthase